MKTKIHVLRTGEVRVSPYLPFGGDDCSLLKASGMTTPKSKWIWLPVFSFLIEHPKSLILFDTGWHREMSPEGVFDKKAQIRSLGSWFLYQINQGRIAKGEAIDEQLASLSRPADCAGQKFPSAYHRSHHHLHRQKDLAMEIVNGN